MASKMMHRLAMLGLAPWILQLRVRAATDSQCFPDTNQPRILVPASNANQADSKFTALTMRTNNQFIIAGGTTEDPNLIPKNWPATVTSAMVIMRVDTESTFTRWIKAYYSTHHTSGFVSALALNSSVDKVFVVFQFGEAGVDYTH